MDNEKKPSAKEATLEFAARAAKKALSFEHLAPGQTTQLEWIDAEGVKHRHSLRKPGGGYV